MPDAIVRSSDVPENGHLCWRRRRRRAGLHDGLISSRKLPQALVCIKLACMFDVGHVAVSHVSASLHFDRLMNGVVTSPCHERRICETVLGHARFMLSIETHDLRLLEWVDLLAVWSWYIGRQLYKLLRSGRSGDAVRMVRAKNPAL